MKISRGNGLMFVSLLTGTLAQLRFSDGEVYGNSKNTAERKGNNFSRMGQKTNGHLEIAPCGEKSRQSLPKPFGFEGGEISDEPFIFRREQNEPRVQVVRFQPENPPESRAVTGASGIASRFESPRPEQVPNTLYGRRGVNHSSYTGFYHKNKELRPLTLDSPPHPPLFTPSRDILLSGNDHHRIQASANFDPLGYRRDFTGDDYLLGFSGGLGNQIFDPNYYFRGYVPLIKPSDEEEELGDEEAEEVVKKKKKSRSKPIKRSLADSFVFLSRPTSSQ